MSLVEGQDGRGRGWACSVHMLDKRGARKTYQRYSTDLELNNSLLLVIYVDGINLAAHDGCCLRQKLGVV